MASGARPRTIEKRRTTYSVYYYLMFDGDQNIVYLQETRQYPYMVGRQRQNDLISSNGRVQVQVCLGEPVQVPPSLSMRSLSFMSDDLRN